MTRETCDEPECWCRELDAYGHLTWVLGNDDWQACFDAVREGNNIHYHAVVNCESGGFIDTIEKGTIPVAEIDKLRSLPNGYIDSVMEQYAGKRGFGRIAYRDCVKRWNKHLTQLAREA
jgi:hypothetical protein